MFAHRIVLVAQKCNRIKQITLDATLDIFKRTKTRIYLEEINMLIPVFDRFIKESPISVMARGAMERVLNPEQLDAWFAANAEQQYTNDLLFSSVFDIMSQVVCQKRPSVNAAYQASKDEIGVSITSVYNKINCIEPHTSAEFVRYSVKEVTPIIEMLGGVKFDPLPGFKTKLLDGNCIKKSQHRIKELRDLAAGPLPGKLFCCV